MKKIKRTILFIMTIFLLSTVSQTAQAKATDLSNLPKYIDELMQNYMEENHVPNASISIVKDEETIFQKGYGYTNIKEDLPVDSETSLFRIGSVSKLFTWTSVMQLVEQGNLDLDTDVNEYLDFKIPHKILNSNNSNPKPITLRDLMTHTPGFEDYSNEIFALNKHDMLPLQEYVKEKLPKRLFPAGEVTAYSNYGTALAGYIVENISGISFSDYIDQHIFKPLHMSQSTFKQPIPSQLPANMTSAYRYVNDQYKEADFEFMPAPAGGMSSTASDMAKFMKAFLNERKKIDDQQLLHPTSIQKMFERQPTQSPALDGMGLGFFERTIHEKRIHFHGGSTMLFDSGLYLFPEENIGIFITYSGADFQFHEHVFQQFMNEYFPIEEKSQPNLSDKENKSKQFIGEYHENRISLTTDDKPLSLLAGIIRVDVDEDGYLEVTHNGTTNRFVESKQGVYKNVSKDKAPDAYGNFATIVFEKDSNENLILTTDGPMTYTKSSWYDGTIFTFSVLIISLVLIFGTLITWVISAIIRLIKKRMKLKKPLLTAKLIVTSFGLLLMILIASIAVTGEVDPVYQLPKDAYMPEPEWNKIIDLLFYAMLVIGTFIIIYTLVAWIKDLWKLRTKIHFSLLSSAVLLLSWIFYYWNLF